ncbi:hexosaminidase [Nocardiopsis arvandica]|uniref:beta-N-acetylhexosaminidase n=1 Tax=Nocardiopsis sinuspersici TaxID=501010 RepID=A0A7Y9XBZ8_9ACTN|nr:family 20 glycosylhydrolase [Nocardiopsis sinuspersici]NYH51500.1 hexosaminidase [Nocardiopsis sinuspersici]
MPTRPETPSTDEGTGGGSAPVDGLVPTPVVHPGGPPVRVGREGRLTLAGAEPAAHDWFAWAAWTLHGLRVEPGRAGADVSVRVDGDRWRTGGDDSSEKTGVDPVTGVDPRPVPGTDERHRIGIEEGRVAVSGASGEGAFRALTSLVQLLSMDAQGDVWAPSGTLEDGPRYAWRGLSLDVVRHFLTAAEVTRVIDLLALHKFNVLHLHLTDSEGWRLESRRWPRLTRPTPDGEREYYTQEEFVDLVEYAALRHVTVVPEVDLPGHTGAAFDAYPELHGHVRPPHPRVRFLHPEVEVARTFARDVIDEFAELTPGPFLHLGGDEPFGMGHGDYVEFVRHAHRYVREAGKRVVGWQETARAGVLTGEDVLQYWIGAPDEFDPEAVKATVPEEFHTLVDQAAETFRISPGDVPGAAESGVPVLLSPNSLVYLDRPYADTADPGQEADRVRLGLPSYEPVTVAGAFDWEPGQIARSLAPGVTVAGVEAAVWGETLTGFDDLAFLLLPRLAGVAEKAWTQASTTWEEHSARLAGYGRFWSALGFGARFRPAEAG